MESFSAETNSTELFSQPLDNPIMILSAVLFSLTFLLGLPGNGLVLWVAGLKMQRTVNMVWFLHLTVADFLCCLSLPFTLAYLVLRGYWPYGWFLCKLIPSVVILNMFASVFLLTAISLDRCLMVFKPIWCQNHRTVKTALTICGCIWVMAFIMCIPVFVYREKFTLHGREMCGYNFDLDYSDFPFDLDFLENRSFYNSIVQLPGDMNNGLDPSSIQTDEQLWTATMDLHSQTFQGPSRDSFPTRLSRQPPRDNLFKPTSVVPPAVPSGFPTEEHGTNPLDHSGAFLPTDLELLPSTSGHSLYVPDLSQDLQYDYLDQYTYVSQPLLVITVTRLVIGFLMPFVIMVTCYTFIACRMKRGRFAKSGSKTIRLAMVVVTVFFVCWAPYHVVRVLVLLFFDSTTPFGKALMAWDYLSIALASANSCFNPFLYALLGKDFRKKARQSLQGILEVAFSEELTHSTSCTRNKAFSEKNSINTTV